MREEVEVTAKDPLSMSLKPRHRCCEVCLLRRVAQTPMAVSITFGAIKPTPRDIPLLGQIRLSRSLGLTML
jgi:hypothetical protein